MMQEMHRLLIATTNPAKLEEARAVLSGESITLLAPKDFSDIEVVAETGATFEENAILKAKGYFAQTGVPCVADDAGLMVDYLNGAPGVASRRWLNRPDPQGLGHEATDQELVNAVTERLKGIPEHKRTARMGGYIAFWDGHTLLTSQNWIEGYITEHHIGEIQPGFPYRGILMIPKFGKVYGALTEAEHAEVNFRRKNLNALKPEILRHLRV